MNTPTPAPPPPCHPYPLLFAPMLLPKVWGGDRLARVGKAVRPGDRVGESWELTDLPSTSSSGAGGGAAVSVIANGDLAGKTLQDAIALWKQSLLGECTTAQTTGNAPTRFPLLVKFLDAREDLSVQVHPSIAYAKLHPETNIKTECWYILDAEPGASIYKGVRPGITRETFERRLREGDGSGVVELLESTPAVPGEMHNLPSGTVHALGAGVLVAEVQTPSDTTFRVYDWGRKGRELHIDQALQCIQFGPARDATKLKPGTTCGRLISTGFFTVDEMVLEDPELLVDDAAPANRPLVVMVIEGSCQIHSTDGAFAPVTAPLGSTLLIPAKCVEGCVLNGPGKVLRVTVLGA